ncbi:MFS transporter [Candidatus Methylospira mobilis]|uniref:MFS transporter n=1 Tax=Candidatus Methylospira mobilis TaxID=1808979 RepID=A0A5Q0BK02_9GAMM|nr:MFS transporter [Candidatus Methylospira mobilis]
MDRSVPESPATARKVIIAACFGTFLEWYDFLTFASLATYFGALFFPPDDPVAALLASLATFGVGMVVRPLGSALFGSLADKYGRRPIFITTIVLMGVATFAVGLLPTYAQAGLWAPALLLLLRLLQGFAVGGEIGGVAVYVTEHAPADKRGAYTSALQLMGPLGILVSTLQVALLQTLLDDGAFHAWGWRVPFLFSAVLLLISLKSRMSLHESPVFLRMQQLGVVAKAPLRECLSDRHTFGRMALLFFCISSGGSLLFFSSQVFAGVFLKSVVRLDAQLSSLLVIISTLLLFPLTLFCGRLSDRIGRRPVVLSGLLLGCIAIMPVFLGLQHFGNPALAQFNRTVPVVLFGASCAYSPFAKAANDCERNQEFLTTRGVAYSTQTPSGDQSAVSVSIAGTQALEGFRPQELAAALHVRGWVERADAGQVDFPMLFLLLSVPVVAVALVTGPQTALLAELFPARTRYTAAALPHNLSAGWIGGLSPFMITLIGVRSGDTLSGLWYPVGLLIVACVAGALFLPETRQVKLDE